jgi:RNA polymerase sigma-70 factor (ECF subfamily)
MENVKSLSIQTHRDYRQVDLALEGSQQAYGVLFKRYRRPVLFAVNKIIADREEARGVAMEAFSKVFFNLHRFRKDYSFNTWLYRVAINHSLDYVRRKRLPTTPMSSLLVEDAYELAAWGIHRSRILLKRALLTLRSQS